MGDVQSGHLSTPLYFLPCSADIYRRHLPGARKKTLIKTSRYDASIIDDVSFVKMNTRYPLGNVYMTMGNHHFSMGKLIISTGPCSIAMLVIARG